MVVGVLAFSVVIILISAVISKRLAKMERSEVAAYVVLIGWVSLLWGLFLMKYAK